MAVQARFYIAEVARYGTGTSRPGYADPAPMGRVVMRPATRGEHNKQWASSTPSGEFNMVVHGSALPWFNDHLGAEVSITIDEVPAPE